MIQNAVVMSNNTSVVANPSTKMVSEIPNAEDKRNLVPMAASGTVRPDMPKKSYFELPAGPMISLAKVQ
jgi:hypothetical protein